ncbi:uncharacterized protein L199_000819 [Kwoniella botswanensis]|uniref:uncharacterized protein n=1 Tax=Kwoniella botswanensis TaxID=1268659 RepID=UPI00315C5A1D
MFHSTRLILSRPSAAIFGSTQGVKTSYGHNEEVYQITLQDGSNYICTREGAPLLAHWGFMDQYHHFNPNSDGRQETFSLIPIQHKKNISDFVLPLKSDSLQDPWDVRALDEASRRFVGNIKHIQRGYIKQASEDFRKF